jgi:hypothetical protein
MQIMRILLSLAETGHWAVASPSSCVSTSTVQLTLWYRKVIHISMRNSTTKIILAVIILVWQSCKQQLWVASRTLFTPASNLEPSRQTVSHRFLSMTILYMAFESLRCTLVSFSTEEARKGSPKKKLKSRAFSSKAPRCIMRVYKSSIVDLFSPLTNSYQFVINTC